MPSAPRLAPLPAPLTREAVYAADETYPHDYIIKNLLQLSSDLIEHSKSNLFGKAKPNDAFSPSLRTLYRRLHKGQLGPSCLPDHLLIDEHNRVLISERIEETVSERPLSDFEDLYYAALSSIKETHQNLNDHIRSGFHRPSSPISPSGTTINSLHAALVDYWTILNEPGWGKAFDDAVREARFEAIRAEIFRLIEVNELDPVDADKRMDILVAQRDDKELAGILFVSTWSPAMISITLQTKYNAVMNLEKQAFEQWKELKQELEEENAAISEKHVTFADKVEIFTDLQCEYNDMSASEHCTTKKSSVKAAPQTPQQPAPKVLDISHKTKNSYEEDYILPQTTYQPPSRREEAGQKEARSEEANQEAIRREAARLEEVVKAAELDEAAIRSEIKAKGDEIERLEAEHTRQEKLREEIEWIMKKQRVSEYKNHLRARASLNAHSMVQAHSTDISMHVASLRRSAENGLLGDNTMGYHGYVYGSRSRSRSGSGSGS